MNEESGTEVWREEPPEEEPEPVARREEVTPGAEVEPSWRPVGRRSLAWLWAVPALVLALACAFLWVQNRAAAATVEALTTRMPVLLVPAGSPNPLAAQLAIVREDAQGHKFLQAKAHAEGLKAPAPSAPASAFVSGGRAATAPEVTPEMAAFFKAHPDLEQRLSAYSDQARVLRDKGKDVQPLRNLRNEILAAAKAGEAERVTALLNEFGKGLEALGVTPAGGDAEMRQVLMQAEQAFNRAQQQGRDPSAGMALIKRAEGAMRAGQRDQALALARQGVVALQRAPRVRRGGATGRAAGSPPGVAEQVAGMAMGVMGAEERDLGAVYAAVEEASRATRENNGDQIREILAGARRTLEQIRDRRKAFGTELSRLSPPRPGSHPATGTAPAQPPSAEGELPQPPHVPEPVERIAELLDQARGLAADKYGEARLALARQALSILLSLGPPAPQGPPAAGQSLTPAEQRAAEQAESRVREKLQLLQGPYQERKRAGQDLTQLDALIRAAREALYAGKLAAAEERADAALREVGVLPEKTGGSGVPQP